MNENYLRYLTSYYNDSPVIDTSLIQWSLLEDYFITVRRPDYSFLKQELRPMTFLPEKRIFTINVGDRDWSQEDIEYFIRRLKESLRVPTQFLDNTDPTYFDEYH